MLVEIYESKIIDGKAFVQLIEREVGSGVESLVSGRGLLLGLLQSF